jgi:hypothetical protein
MPAPLAICIENMREETTPRFMRCVALPGRKPGLRMNNSGRILWQTDEAVACELWVSGDDKLILYRPEGAMPLALHRAGRSLDVPFEKPVVIIDKDEIDIGKERFRIHVHGNAPSVVAPSPYVPTRAPSSSGLAKAAAAAIIGGLAATSCSDIEIREAPPVVMPEVFEPPEETPPTEAPEETPATEPTGETPAAPAPEPPIEVREDPPDIVITVED